MPSIATFNANNFFLRYQFTNTYPGDQSRSSQVEAAQVGLVGYLPGLAFGQYTSRFIIWDGNRRQIAARALAEPDGQLPDILCFQEVENIHAIRRFNQVYLGNHYNYSVLIDSYDTRNIDVGVLSRFALEDIRSHIDEGRAAGNPLFSRDCLEVTVQLPTNEPLTLFVNHFKSKYIRREANESDANFNARRLADHEKRRRQSNAVREYVRERLSGQLDTALYAVIGDFNDTQESPYIQRLLGYNRLTDIVRRHRTANDCWTYYWRARNRVSQIDYILVSRALRDRVDAVVAADANRIPHIERAGLGFRELNANNEILPSRPTLRFFEPDPVTPPPAGATPDERVDFRFQRYPAILANWRANISDHCPVKVWF